MGPPTSLARDFCESTTIHGPPHAYSASSIVGKGFWVILTLIGIFLSFISSILVKEFAVDDVVRLEIRFTLRCSKATDQIPTSLILR